MSTDDSRRNHKKATPENVTHQNNPDANAYQIVKKKEEERQREIAELREWGEDESYS